MEATVIGGGLAGSEAAWQIANAGFPVTLIEMRPNQMTKAHKTGKYAELVCSNSLRGAALTNAVGLLKEELRVFGSVIMKAADIAKVPAGGALAVDREVFSEIVTEEIKSHPLITRVEKEVTEIPQSTPSHPVVIATGPLTSKPLAISLQKLIGGDQLSFFDAISPIIFGESINWSKVFKQSRYDKGDGADYVNIPLEKESYLDFIDKVTKAEKFGAHDEVESDEIENLRPFEGCMPIEEMVSRGVDTLRFGPMKPIGLTDPATGRRPYAVIQLRQDDKDGQLWSMVGFQTRMRHGDQVKVFQSLPGLEGAEFLRLGTVHRNTFIDSPRCLSPTLQLRDRLETFIAGQITGVEGYVESTAGGCVAGFNVIRMLRGEAPKPFPADTAIGSLMGYISDPDRKFFQPMNISFGLMSSYFEEPETKKKDKNARRLKVAERALNSLKSFLKDTRGLTLGSG